jgi:hypothetical protein
MRSIQRRVLSLVAAAAVVVVPQLQASQPPSPEPAHSSGGALKGGGGGPDCLVGQGLGSTLLVPYFEVDLDDPDGVTTLISVNNGYSNPTLTHLVMWTDWGVPTAAFDIYLEGFDVQSINVRSLFNGVVPVTGVGADLSLFQYCDTRPPHYPTPALTPGEIAQLRTAHTGQSGHIDGLCYAADHGDGIARGFITVDVVDQCSGLEGHEPFYTPANGCCSYFADGGGGAGVAVVDNRLWGDVIYVDYADNAAQATEAVAIWADPLRFSGTDIYTFYGRNHGYDGRDERAPLPSIWDQRFFNGGAFSGGADLIVFQLPNMSNASPVACGTTPAWWPLPLDAGSFDEQAGNYTAYPNAFGLVTQRVSVGSLAPPYDFGWMQVGHSDHQVWVQPSLTALGRFSASFNGVPVSFLCGVSPP